MQAVAISSISEMSPGPTSAGKNPPLDRKGGAISNKPVIPRWLITLRLTMLSMETRSVHGVAVGGRSSILSSAIIPTGRSSSFNRWPSWSASFTEEIPRHASPSLGLSMMGNLKIPASRSTSVSSAG